jgi:DNA-binding IclR family transcriptional regulator
LDEAVDLSVFDHHQALYIEMIQSTHTLTIAATVGQRLPAYCTASGKVFLAYLTPAEIDDYLSQSLTSYTKNTVTQPELIRAQLATIREKGYAFDDEEYEVGVRAVAAPIRNQKGKVAAAVSVPCPASRLTLARLPEVAGVLISSTLTISRRLGWIG